VLVVGLSFTAAIKNRRGIKMIHILIGAVIGISFYLLVDFTRKRRIKISWWQWILTILGFLYATFVLAMIVSFLDEGAYKAAMVMGSIMGFIAVVWGVLLARFVFGRNAPETT
jgi:hypothetical protein